MDAVIVFTENIEENQKHIDTCFYDTHVIETQEQEDFKYTTYYKIVGVDKEYVSCLAFDDLPGHSYRDYNGRMILHELVGSFRIVNILIKDLVWNSYCHPITLEEYEKRAYEHINTLLNLQFPAYQKERWEKELEKDQEEYLSLIEEGDTEKIEEYHEKKFANSIIEEELSDELKESIKDIIINEHFDDIDPLF